MAVQGVVYLQAAGSNPVTLAKLGSFQQNKLH